MQKRIGVSRFGVAGGAAHIIAAHKKSMGLGCSAAAGYIMASSEVFGGISPFGVALCASLPMSGALFAALGSAAGYIFSSAKGPSIKYLTAIAVVIGVKWLFDGRAKDRHATLAAALTALAALTASCFAAMVTSETTLYDLLICAAEVLLGSGAAYFFSRSRRALESGLDLLGHSDISCLAVSVSIVVMGLSSVTIGGLSVGRIAAALTIMLCARCSGEAGGAVAGITAGVAMGIAGGDYTYTIGAYGFGGLVSGMFSCLGRIASAGAFIAVNTMAALFTRSSGEAYTALFEIFAASVIFVAIPRSAIARLRQAKPGRLAESDAAAQSVLRGRLEEVSGALLDISTTTRAVSQRVDKMESDGLNGVHDRVSERICTSCGMKTTCWQFKYTDTMNAVNDALILLKRDGSVSRARMPEYFTRACCRPEDFVAELNTQFQMHVARESTRRKVSRVRQVLTDQFEGMAMMLDEISGELCGAVMLEGGQTRKVREYFEKEGINVRQARCFKDGDDRVTVEIALPEYQLARLKPEKAALDLSSLLDAEFDLPCLTIHRESASAAFSEKAAYVAEMGAHQIFPNGNRLCGDAYESIANRFGKAHFILSDGMGCGGSAAVESNMASSLLARMISVGFTHEAALRMVNSALLIKSGEESLATVDVCTLDLYTGRAEFYKAGAAPTFLIRSGRVGYVESASLPAGILQGVAFDKSRVSLRESDIIVMVSDGVTASGIEWVKSELESMRGQEVQRIAEKLAMTAKIRRNDSREDDITVLAIALKRGS